MVSFVQLSREDHPEVACSDSECLQYAGEGDNGLAIASEVAALRSQMRIFRGVALGSLAVSMVALAMLAHNTIGGTSLPSRTQLVEETIPTTQLWQNDAVIVPYGFKSCDSAAEPPQIAPIREKGGFLFLSGILGYDTPCKSAVRDGNKQIEAAFKWADDTLSTAKVSWSDVMSVTSYHVNLTQHQETFAAQREKYMPKPPYPAWTAVGVNQLYFEHEVFEMTIIAKKPECVGLECDASR